MVLEQYPFQLSGGMLQRVMIALAIWMKPEIIIADEPTTALDVTVQKEILNQFKKVRDMFGVTILLITHDFGVVAELADEVIVMKEGRIVEKGSVFEIFNSPKALYTKALLKATFEKEVNSIC
jgi:ABC-type dipeptide/oligopeptide/nickel transport system ATPase component